MEYLLINKSTIQGLCSSIGWRGENGSYNLTKDCLKSLNLIDQKLQNENPTTRDVRISLGLSNLVENDLVKILETTDIKKDYELIEVTLKVLVNLTLPTEWLLTSDIKFASKNNSFALRLKELQKILLKAKKAFVKSPKSTTLLIKAMRLVSTNCSPSSTPLASENGANCDNSSENIADNLYCDHPMVKNCLLIFRNLLHIPDRILTLNCSKTINNNNGKDSFRNSINDWQDTQKRMIWNLLVQGLDNSLLYLMSTSLRRCWTPHIVQIISLMYHDQPVNKIGQHILARNGASDCSDDDVESDHTLSAQRSSSTSVFSDSSSSKESASNSSQDNNKNDSGFSQSTESERTGSDTSSQLTSKTKAFELVALEEKNEEDQLIVSSELTTYKQIDKDSLNEREEEEDVKVKLNNNDNVQDPQKQIDTTKCENKLERKNFDHTQITDDKDCVIAVNCSHTSGFSGSSEDDCNRKMHKVMKPHQRSGIKLRESDSSDDSDCKNKMAIRAHHHVKKSSTNHKGKTLPISLNTSNGNTNSVNNGSTNLVNCNLLIQSNNVGTSLPMKGKKESRKQSTCYPAFCMDAALVEAFSRLQTDSINCRVFDKDDDNYFKCLPWNKKKTCGSKSTSIGSESAAPTDNDIRFLLEEFTLKFLHNFFSQIVCDLSSDLTKESNHPSFDISNLLWLLGYFLKIANIIDLKFTHLSSIFKPQLFGLLVFNGVLLNEQLEHASSNLMRVTNCPSNKNCPNNNKYNSSPNTNIDEQIGDENIKKVVRKLQLLVTALKEMILTVSNYIDKPDLGEDEKNLLNDLQLSLAKMNDLKQFFLLLIRCYSPIVHPKCLLIDVISAHHFLLILLDKPFKDGFFDLFSHLQQFSTIRVMEQYGRVLESFKSNSESLNNYLFSIMHHIAGDLGNPECLFQPTILKTFSLIMQSDDDELLDSWEDLIEYVMNRFVRAASRSNVSRLTNLVESKMDKDNASIITSTNQTRDATICTSISSESIASHLSSLDAGCLEEIDAVDQCLNNQDKDQLNWLFLQYEQANCPITCILEALMEEQPSVNISREDLVNQLIARGLINEGNSVRLLDDESVDVGKSKISLDNLTLCVSNSQESIKDPQIRKEKSDCDNEIEEIEQLIDKINKGGLSEQLNWISNVLIDVCNVKMFQAKKCIPKGCLLQPIAYYCEGNYNRGCKY